MPNNHHRLLKRISVDPKVMAGKPVIRGTRLAVHYILELLADGETVEDILEEYDGLTREDIMACLAYASRVIDHSTFMPMIGA